MATFQKGHAKLGGRKAGTPNKSTTELREWVQKLVQSNMAQVKRDLKELEPKERLDVIERLMRYVLPRQQAIMAEVDGMTMPELEQFRAWKNQQDRYAHMTDEELIAENERINNVIKNL